MKIKLLITGLACIATTVLVSGCAGVTRGTPHAGTVINANLNASDMEVLEKTEGKSTKVSVLLGLVQVIDGDKYRILGIKFFEDQYAFIDKPSGLLSIITPVSIEERAYYKALAATPDADSVMQKAFVATSSGVPILYKSQEVTYQGKALKYKVHN